MWFTSPQWGWSSSGSRMLQCGVQQCQNILKVWSLANYFSRTGYFQLDLSVSAASTSLTHQNLPKDKLISLFSLFSFILPIEVKQINMVSPPSRKLMMPVWQPHGSEGDSPLRWLFSIMPGPALQSSPRVPRTVRAEPGRIPFDHSPQISCC